MYIPNVLLFLDFGGGEIIIILLVILVVLGPEKIPEFARKAGDIMRFVRKATDDIKTEINKETDAVKKPFQSAYDNVSAFSKNAQDAMNSTLDDIKIDETGGNAKEATGETDETEAKGETKGTKENGNTGAKEARKKTDKVSLADIDKEIAEEKKGTKGT